MVGQYVRPQSSRPMQGTPPSTPEEAEGLKAKWMAALSNPAVGAGLFQFGASMLANSGNKNFVQNMGVALGDAGGAAGRTQKFIAEGQRDDRALSQADQRIGLESERVKQSAEQNAATRAYQQGSLGLQGKQLEATTANNQGELALRKQELESNAAYRAATLALQGEQLKVSQSGILSPRGRALNELLKAALGQQELDPNFDAAGYIERGLPLINQMFGGGETAVPGVPAAPAPMAPTGAPAPGAAAPAAAWAPGMPVPTEAVKELRAAPTPEMKAQFDAVFGKGAADKALGTAMPATPSLGDPNTGF